MTYPLLTGPTDSDSLPADGDDSTWINRRATETAQRAANARKGSGRRRLIDPATCERDYSQAEVEFMQAMQAYKTTSGRSFPTWGEVLQVVQRLGYQKLEPEKSSAKRSD
ncbi:hypothetical protein SAMN05444166_5881 [Singulisphaera sp. GP187]|uniref:hypothetical protein n=1 Tax=Singulisphaera sp. GP187 TaxID=1882752 RepID=UPI0009293FDA|nr:hypothetical protein [Singulisphaera sp. GP187]SIO58978.1 hypothetical protein SAMN05444166_5881 [Singulisphaera sp. GP187]